MMRFENTVISTLCVHLILAVGYRPLTVLTVVIFIQGLTSSLFLAEELAQCLVYIKSLLNPVFYCYKIKRNRRAVKKLYFILLYPRKLDINNSINNETSLDNWSE